MGIIKSDATSDVLTLDPTSEAARATLYDTVGNALAYADNDSPTKPRGLLGLGVNDKNVFATRLDRLGNVGTTLHTVLFHESFQDIVINPQKWTITNTTMVSTQATVSGLTFNSGNITTINTGYMLKSSTSFAKMQKSPIQMKFRARFRPIANSVIEVGFGDATTFNGANTAGAYWQYTSTGILQPVLTFNSVDVTGTGIETSINSSNFYTFDIIIDDNSATFTCQDSSTGNLISRQTINLPSQSVRLLSIGQIPSIARLYNTAIAPRIAASMDLSDVYILTLDNAQNKPWPIVSACNVRGMPSHPFNGTQLGGFFNNTAPTNAGSLNNVTLGYTTLGGWWQFSAIAGADTDYALFGFTVPNNSNLVITGINITAINIGATVATTPTLLIWGLAVGTGLLSATTLNRILLGSQSFPVGSLIGANAQKITKQFTTPVYCPSGQSLYVILRMPVATATASQVLQGIVSIEGYFE